MIDDNINETNIEQLTIDEKDNLRGYFSHMKASPMLKVKIQKKIDAQLPKTSVNRKPLLLVASITFLLGLGMILPLPFTKLPTIAQLHSNTNLQFQGNDVNELSKMLGIAVDSTKLQPFKNAGFTVLGANKRNVFGKSIAQIILNNSQGKKVSINFLPGNYKPCYCNCHKTEVIGVPTNHKWVLSRGNEILDVREFPDEMEWVVFKANHNGLPFDFGESERCHFTYWKQDGQVIAIVSEELTEMEMISLAMPLRKTI